MLNYKYRVAMESKGNHSMGSDTRISRLLDRLEPKRAVILCASRIGDFVCATPAFRALKKRLPVTKFTLIGLPFVREMAERSPHLDDFEPFPGFPGMAEQFFDARNALAFFRRMQRLRFDLALQMHGSGLYSNTFSLMLGAAYTAGFVREGDGQGRLNAALTWPASLPAARRALALAVFLGAPDCGQETEFILSPDDHQSAEALLEGCGRRLIGLHPGSREADKIWPEERFAATGSALRRMLRGTVVILGGPQEQRTGERLCAMLDRNACNLAGRKSLGEMGAVIARLSVLITNDSGPAHIAYALGIPTVTLFGKTDPAEWGPPGRSCHRVLRGKDHSMLSIKPSDVMQAALEVVRFPP